MITPPGDISVLSLSRYGFFSAIVLILGIYAIIQRFRQILAFREFGSINGCAEIPNRRQKWWKLGIDTIYESYRWKKQHSYLELLQKNFDDYGKTYSSRVLGTNKLTTMDPANVEAILKPNGKISLLVQQGRFPWTVSWARVCSLPTVPCGNNTAS
jgi:hypothetical protein